METVPPPWVLTLALQAHDEGGTVTHQINAKTKFIALAVHFLQPSW